MNKCLVIGTLLSLLLSDPAAAAAPKWKCGEWKKHPTGKCTETRTCTRTLCDTKNGKLVNCRTETKTECVKRETTKTPSSLRLEGLPSSENMKVIKDPSTTVPEGLRRPGVLEQPADPPPRTR